jgi:hypothetical protein
MNLLPATLGVRRLLWPSQRVANHGIGALQPGMSYANSGDPN